MTQTQFPDLHRKFNKAIEQYQMVVPGDRVIIAVSGGKDSYTLFDLFCRYKDTLFAEVKFLVVTVQTDITCSGSIPQSVIKKQADECGMEYEVIYFPISEEAGRKKVDCFYCALRRRTALIKRAFQSNFNRIAFGHHLDDIVETTIMNQMHHANISTMPPRIDLFDGKLAIIRPLATTFEFEARDYANAVTFVPPKCRCPGLDVSTRRDTKEFLSALEEVEPNVKANFYKAMERLGSA